MFHTSYRRKNKYAPMKNRTLNRNNKQMSGKAAFTLSLRLSGVELKTVYSLNFCHKDGSFMAFEVNSSYLRLVKLECLFIVHGLLCRDSFSLQSISFGIQ